MPRIRHPDETRIAKLETWLQSIGQIYERIGDDVCMPSPFKEADKRKTLGPNYVDMSYRLSVTIEDYHGTPTILWQCWYTKRADGKAFGGTSAYALARRTGVSQEKIYQILDLKYDEVVKQAETLEEKVIAILTQGKRQEAARASAEAVDAQTTLKPLPQPPNLLPLYKGLPFTSLAEALMERRGILPETAQLYQISWNLDTGKVWFPWYDQQGNYATHQWYDLDASRYFFPKREPGFVTHGDLIFGLNLWTPAIPLVLCEGTFDALTLRACGLGGSTLSDAQMTILVDIAPQMIILALDKDKAGINGTQAIYQKIRPKLPHTKIITVFPPKKDWNDLAKVSGQMKTLEEFCRRVKAAEKDPLGEKVRQILQ